MALFHEDHFTRKFPSFGDTLGCGQVQASAPQELARRRLGVGGAERCFRKHLAEEGFVSLDEKKG